MLWHQANVGPVVPGAEERLLPPIPPVGHVVQDAGRHHPGNSGHGPADSFPSLTQEFSIVSPEFHVVPVRNVSAEPRGTRAHRAVSSSAC